MICTIIIEVLHHSCRTKAQNQKGRTSPHPKRNRLSKKWYLILMSPFPLSPALISGPSMKTNPISKISSLTPNPPQWKRSLIFKKTLLMSSIKSSLDLVSKMDTMKTSSSIIKGHNNSQINHKKNNNQTKAVSRIPILSKDLLHWILKQLKNIKILPKSFNLLINHSNSKKTTIESLITLEILLKNINFPTNKEKEKMELRLMWNFNNKKSKMIKKSWSGQISKYKEQWRMRKLGQKENYQHLIKVKEKL